MKKLLFVIAALLPLFATSCSKENVETFDISQLWWKGDTYGGNTTMYIKFISDTEFEFKDEGKSSRPSYMSGKGKYIKSGTSITFDFETYNSGLARGYIRLSTGEWDKFPTTKEDAKNSKLTIKGLHWTKMGDVETSKEEWESTLTYDYSQNGW